MYLRGLLWFHRSYKMVVYLINGYNAFSEIFLSCCFKIIRPSNRTSGIKLNFIQFIWINWISNTLTFTPNFWPEKSEKRFPSNWCDSGECFRHIMVMNNKKSDRALIPCTINKKKLISQISLNFLIWFSHKFKLFSTF